MQKCVEGSLLLKLMSLYCSLAHKIFVFSVRFSVIKIYTTDETVFIRRFLTKHFFSSALQERFQDAAMISVNMANWFTRMWKYAPEVVGQSEYLLHSVLIFGTELSDDIFAFGNCYDEKQYKNYTLFCPYAYR